MDEENSGVVTLGPGTSSETDSAETEIFRPRTHDDQNDDIQDHQEDEQSQIRNGDVAERMFNRFEGQMMAFNENLTQGFDIMHNQMRNLIGAVKDKMVNAMANYGLHKTENHENTHEMGTRPDSVSRNNIFFSDNTNIVFLWRKARIFFPEFNIRLYDKNSESNYFFFSTKIKIFFSATLGIRIFI
jgi:hypothetical protein